MYQNKRGKLEYRIEHGIIQMVLLLRNILLRAALYSSRKALNLM